MRKKILTVAKNYQKLSRQLKELEAKMKPLKEILVDYGKSHRSDFDDAFQLKFDNGTYISLRTKSVINGDKESKENLAFEFEELGELKLNEKACAEAFAVNNRLKKRMKTLGLSVVEKESYAVYAG